MKNKLLGKLKKWTTNFLLIQLMVTLTSLPILIWWGLPISKVSFIGNLIFTPVLTIFLIISSLVFFTEFLNIPNLYLIKILEKITTLWNSILVCGQKNWLVGFSRINIIFIVSIPVITFVTMSNKKINTPQKKSLFCLPC